MDVENEYFIIEKHWQKNGRDHRHRRFFKIGELEKAFELARNYANAQNIDFLVVKVVRELSKPAEGI